MEKYSAEWVKEQVGDRTKLPLRDCSFCNRTLYYLVQEGRVYFDSNCDCVSYTTIPMESSFDAIASTLAMQDSDNIRDIIMGRLLSYEPAQPE